MFELWDQMRRVQRSAHTGGGDSTRRRPHLYVRRQDQNSTPNVGSHHPSKLLGGKDIYVSRNRQRAFRFWSGERSTRDFEACGLLGSSSAADACRASTFGRAEAVARVGTGSNTGSDSRFALRGLSSAPTSSRATSDSAGRASRSGLKNSRAHAFPAALLSCFNIARSEKQCESLGCEINPDLRGGGARAPI